MLMVLFGAMLGSFSPRRQANTCLWRLGHYFCGDSGIIFCGDSGIISRDFGCTAGLDCRLDLQVCGSLVDDRSHFLDIGLTLVRLFDSLLVIFTSLIYDHV